MISKWNKLPMDLVNKIMSYQPIESPAVVAWNKAEIREVKSNELWCNVSGEITLNDEDINDVELEWYVFSSTNADF